jgi:hypothetical protein
MMLRQQTVCLHMIVNKDRLRPQVDRSAFMRNSAGPAPPRAVPFMPHHRTIICQHDGLGKVEAKVPANKTIERSAITVHDFVVPDCYRSRQLLQPSPSGRMSTANVARASLVGRGWWRTQRGRQPPGPHDPEAELERMEVVPTPGKQVRSKPRRRKEGVQTELQGRTWLRPILE